MIIYAIDDEPLALHVVCQAIVEAAPEAELANFTSVEKFRQAIDEKPCDVAFLDIQLRGLTGLDLAQEIRKKYPKINIIFVTGFRQYMGEAWDLMASGYVTKPATAEKVKQQLDNLRFPILTDPGVHAVTFGHFTLKKGQKTIEFHRSKSKELLAYLIDCRGAAITRREAADILFEDGQYGHNEQSHLNLIIKELQQDLTEAGAEDLLEVTPKTLSVRTDTFHCDSYDYLDGKPGPAYSGEYMVQYSWAEQSQGKFMK